MQKNGWVIDKAANGARYGAVAPLIDEWASVVSGAKALPLRSVTRPSRSFSRCWAIAPMRTASRLKGTILLDCRRDDDPDRTPGPERARRDD